MAYVVTDLAPHEIIPGTFAYKGDVYHIDAEGNIYQWDQDAQLGGFFKSIGKIFKKAFKIVKKVAPVAALAYTGYGFATALASGASVGAAAQAALLGPSSIVGKVAQGVQYLASGSSSPSTPPPIDVGPQAGLPGGANTPIVVGPSTGSIASGIGSVLPAATAAVSAYYNSQAQRLQAQMYGQQQFPGVSSGIPGTPSYVPPGQVPQGQGLPVFSSTQSGFIQPTSEQTPSGIPDVTPTMEKYKMPILIGMGLVGLALVARK